MRVFGESCKRQINCWLGAMAVLMAIGLQGWLPAGAVPGEDVSNISVVLNQAEKDWLAKHREIRLAVDTGWAPFEFVDDKKNYRGMAAEFIRLVEKRLGISLTIDKTRSWQEMVKAVKNRDLDVFSLVVKTPQRDKYVNFTKPYISFPMVIITLDKESYVDGIKALRKQTVAVVKSYASHDLLAKNHPNLKLLLVKNVQEGLEAVSHGKAYAFIGNLAVASQVIRESGISNIKVSGQTPYRFELSMGVRKDWPELVPILQKGLDSVSAIERDQIYNRWIRVEFQEKIDYRIIIGILLTAFIIFSAIFAWNRMLQKEVNHRLRVESRLKLLASVFTSAREGIMISEPDGTIIDVNKAFCRITGYGKKEVIGKNQTVLKGCTQPSIFNGVIKQQLLEKQHWSGEVCKLRKNGEKYPEMLTVSAVLNDKGDIQHTVALFSDITEIKNYQNQLERLAHFDPLTELPNRVTLVDRLHQEMAHVLRNKQKLAVVYIDLDGFKEVNDSYGHQAGDELLIKVSDRMNNVLRKGDTLSRIGGDEFVAIFTNLDHIESCILVLERLLGAVSEKISVDGHDVNVSASIGVTFYPQKTVMESGPLMRQADQAMYQAKLDGKNCYRVFDTENDQFIKTRHEHMEQARNALKNQEFVMHYQPKVNMRTGEIIGAEALLRWQHPERGMLYPEDFSWMFEDHAFSIELGEWVISAAVRQIDAWQSAGFNIVVSVNVSPFHLGQTTFVSRLTALLAEQPGVTPQMLELEVLENSESKNLEQMHKNMVACREVGVGFSLDDFGTGYSSLLHLKHLPVASLKIDQGFVEDILDDLDDLAIVKGILGLAKAFGISVVAEGVATHAHGERLLMLDCELAQGHAIAEAMPAEDWPAWRLAWHRAPLWGKAGEGDKAEMSNQSVALHSAGNG